MKSPLIVAVVMLGFVVLAANTHATEYEKCAAEFDMCLKACDAEHGSDTAGRAACTPVCSGKYAACDAGVAYDKAKPWIEEQAGKTKKFIEDLMDRLKKEAPDQEPMPAPDPEGMPTEKSI